jgi:outer membrane protein assembly complex protein YaeT
VRATLSAFTLLTLCGCAARARVTEIYPALGQYAGRQIRDVGFVGGAPFSEDSLQNIVQTKRTKCSLLGLPFCFPFTRIGRQEHDLSPETVANDLVRLSSFYRYEGYFGTTVSPEVDEEGSGVRVTFVIHRAAPIYVDTVAISGTEGVVDPDSLERRVPLQPGDIFDLGKFANSADTVLRTMQARGHAYAEVLRNFNVDTAIHRAFVGLEAIPGPRVEVDSIIVEGASKLGRRVVLRQLVFGKGELLQTRQMIQSERNLYNLDIVQVATVSVAPDSLQVSPADSTTATVLVRIAEAPQRQVDAALGWGTVECFRAEGRWENRSLGGGARSLVLAGSVSKLGIGAGLGGSVCSAFEADTFANRVDYRFAADLTQPYFLDPRNELSFTVFAERQSQPLVFQREAVGTGVKLTRRLSTRTFLTSGVDIERGSTLASELLFCGALQVCDPPTIDILTAPRYRSTIGASVLRDATDVPINPTKGSIARTALLWAPTWLRSDVTFVRWTGELALYRPLRPQWVAAGSFRFGNFFQTALPGSLEDFLPPEDRLYAGGATTVRGYDRNALGPGVYVTQLERSPATGDSTIDRAAARFIPSGGTSMVVLNAELRMPSPILPRNMGLVVFVDAGSVTTEQAWSSFQDLKVTPGVGLRFQTPVGPVRFDLAFNPNAPTEGPLFVADPETGTVTRVLDSFQPERSFLGKFRIHLSIGQAF